MESLKLDVILFSVIFLACVAMAIGIHWDCKNAYDAVAAMVANGADPVRARAAIDGDYAVLIECGNGQQ